jgi:hypothetical protein
MAKTRHLTPPNVQEMPAVIPVLAVAMAHHLAGAVIEPWLHSDPCLGVEWCLGWGSDPRSRQDMHLSSQDTHFGLGWELRSRLSRRKSIPTLKGPTASHDKGTVVAVVTTPTSPTHGRPPLRHSLNVR